MAQPTTESWKIELYNKLLADKIQQIETEENRKKDETLANVLYFENEAERLLIEITNYDPSDRWQYRKGLRLMYLGTQLGNQHYKDQGHQFLKMTCGDPATGYSLH